MKVPVQKGEIKIPKTCKNTPRVEKVIQANVEAEIKDRNMTLDLKMPRT